MGSPEQEEQAPARFLGITSESAQTESDYFHTFVTNIDSEQRYAAETFSRIAREQPALAEYYFRRREVFKIEDIVQFGRGHLRTYNILPERHTSAELTADEVASCLKSIYGRYDAETLSLDISWYLRLMRTQAPAYFNWVSDESFNPQTGSKATEFIVASMFLTMPFYFRDQDRELHRTIDTYTK